MNWFFQLHRKTQFKKHTPYRADAISFDDIKWLIYGDIVSLDLTSNEEITTLLITNLIVNTSLGAYVCQRLIKLFSHTQVD